MGNCFTRKKSSSTNGNNSSSSSSATNGASNNRKTTTKPPSTNTVTSRKQDVSNYLTQKAKEAASNKARNSNAKISSKKHSGVIPCGKRTDFGYDKNFEKMYIIGKLLGHGQFGYTYAATDKATGDRVAVKKIEKNKMILPIAVEDVRREVKILSALTGHENVVQFHNAFEDENSVYIVMELCEGGELLDRILAKKDSRYSEKDAAIIVRQMLKVAAECHLHGMVHRDMKPEVWTISFGSFDGILLHILLHLQFYMRFFDVEFSFQITRGFFIEGN
nr:calcium-dependent protein kinase 18-like [Ipomoea batatas]